MASVKRLEKAVEQIEKKIRKLERQVESQFRIFRMLQGENCNNVIASSEMALILKQEVPQIVEAEVDEKLQRLIAYVRHKFSFNSVLK